jgi:hypothetical protein
MRYTTKRFARFNYILDSENQWNYMLIALNRMAAQHGGKAAMKLYD